MNIKKLVLAAALFAIVLFPQLSAETITPQNTNSAIEPIDRSREWWQKRHQAKLDAARGFECQLLFIGDSITHGWEGSGKEVWQKYYASRKAFNIGFSGDKTEHVLWRMDHGELADFQPKAAVIMIGTNNTGHQMQKAVETAEGIKAIISRIQKHSPKTQVLLLAVFPRGSSPGNPKRKLNDEINAIIKTYDDGKMVHYLDIAPAFLDSKGYLPKEVMPDLLHPKAHGYKLWAEAMEPTLARLFGERATYKKPRRAGRR